MSSLRASPNIVTTVQADSSRKIPEFQNLRSQMNEIPLLGGNTISNEPKNMKNLLDGKINFKKKFNKNDHQGNFRTI
jgi:hypothetical protein